MRIYDLQVAERDGWLTASSRVQWENAGRPDTSIEFRIAKATGIAPACRPEAFLLAAVVPAAAAGEERVYVEGAVCGLLYESIPSALAILKHWFPKRFPDQPLPRIEALSISAATDRGPDRTAGFYSGGVDSTHLLLANTERFPVGHPERIAHGVCVYGFDMGGRVGQDGSEPFNFLLQQSSPLLSSLGIKPLPVYTNLRHLDDRPGFWGEVFVGFALAAVAHALSGEFSRFFRASSGEPIVASIQEPSGYHPSLLLYTDSKFIRTIAPYLEVSRQQRLRLIAQNPAALQALRVCFYCDEKPVLNCGTCEKCVRTQLGLMLCGIDPTPYFAGVKVNAELLHATDLHSDEVGRMYEELRDGMDAIGNLALRDAIDMQLKRLEKYLRWKQGKTLGGRLRGAFSAAPKKMDKT